ncbi:MAG: helix-turn-helix domain-containing protein [Leptolyngbyaceae cyanobacterium RU_5_1]|nr:helix-turn-helix domain-containing protein [Leptolyngbyaceae cyanobacterium RU_5_1]
MQIELRPEYRRRIEIMLLADDGQSQTEICAMLGCSQETARHWIGMARAGRAHQWDDCPVGRPQVINDQYVDRLKELVNRSPRDYGYPFKRWTAQVLSKHLANELGIDISNRHINRLLKKMGLSTRSSNTGEVANLSRTKNFGIAIRDLQPASSIASLLPISSVQMSH